jgi:hypothetical protein
LGVPVKLSVTDDPEQTAESAENDAVAKLFTVMVTASFLILLHVFRTGEVTVTSE